MPRPLPHVIATAHPWRVVDGGIALAVRVTPKSSRDRVEGLASRGALVAVKVRVRAVPEDGKANVAVAGLVAEWLDLPPRSVTVSGGAASRDKILMLRGDPSTLAPLLAAKLRLEDTPP